MTRKDYILIAAAARRALECREHFYVSGCEDKYTCGVKSVAVSLANMLAEDNPRFDRLRFLAACNVENAV